MGVGLGLDSVPAVREQVSVVSSSLLGKLELGFGLGFSVFLLEPDFRDRSSSTTGIVYRWWRRT